MVLIPQLGDKLGEEPERYRDGGIEPPYKSPPSEESGLIALTCRAGNR